MRISKSNLGDVFRAKKCGVETMQLKGYELIEECFVDNSGLGTENEPALTKTGFQNRMVYLIDKHGTLTAKITSVGQFQVYVGFFKKTGKSISKKIGYNLYEINYPEKYAIRYHDTDILTFTDKTCTLNSGGWHTSTTKKYMNKYLPKGFYVFQKNFVWYLKNNIENKIIPFSDGMKIETPNIK